MKTWPKAQFREFLKPNSRTHTLGAEQDANLVGMRWYGAGPFHRELKFAMQITKKSHFMIRDGDVIFNKLFAWKGAFGIVPPELDGMFVSDKFPTYELDHRKVNPSFLRWYFKWPPLWEQARLMSTGSAALSKLTLNPPKFLLLEISLPSLTEQQEIVAQIEELAAKIADARRLRSQADVETAALVKAALYGLVKDIKLSGKLGDILEGPPRNGWSAKCDNAEGGTPVLSLSAVTQFHYRETEFKRTSLHAKANGHFWLKPGDILITRSNTPELVGHAAIYDGRPTPCIYPDLMMRLEIKGSDIDRRFVWYWLQSPIAREFITKNAKGTSPTMKKISQGIVMSIPFPTSFTLSEQRRIVAELGALQAHVDRMKRLQAETAAELDALLPSILDRAFKGEL